MANEGLSRSQGTDPASGRAPYIGRALPRFEDIRFITGTAKFTDDFSLEGEMHIVFVRSPHASARILSIDKLPALTARGVVAVLTGADYLADGGRGIMHFANPADAADHTIKAFREETGGEPFEEPCFPFAVERVRYLGEPVALVVGATREDAEDGAGLVSVQYEALRPIISARDALAPGAPKISENCPGNLALTAEFGDREATSLALQRSDVVITATFINQRIAAAQMEPRSAIARFDAKNQTLLMIAGSQGVIRQRDQLASALGLHKEQCTVLCPDVGGGFGARSNLASEQLALAWAARKLGGALRWTSSRSDAFLSDFQGRGIVAEAKLGVTRAGRILGYDVDAISDLGAYPVSYVPPSNFARVMTSVYDIKAAHIRLRGALTNTVPTAPFRGAGRPEAIYVIECMLDIAARQLGINRIAVREANLIPRARLPYVNAMGLRYESGDFAANMAEVLKRSDWEGFEARRAKAKRNGRIAGIGLANYIESPVGAPHERVDIRVDPAGFVEVVVGTQSTGQGHETSFAQVMADCLGTKPEEIKLVTGDTRIVASGGGTHSDRSMRLVGSLIIEGAQKIVAQAKQRAAQLFACASSDVDFEDGLFIARNSNRRFHIFEIARAAAEQHLPAELQKPLASSASFTGRLPAFPTGAAVAEVEIDPATGHAVITRYTTIDDVGQPINPLILHGQVHGGVAQGLGQVFSEHMTVDADGQVLTGSFADYAVPIAEALPDFDVALSEDPTAGNRLRIKGAGESGITPSLAAAMSAVADALSEFGIEHIDMPATAYRVWVAMQAKRPS